MKVISFDPSGNWGREGMGTTGICIMVNGEPTRLLEIKASEYISEEAYWQKHVDAINYTKPDFVVMEGFKLYNHKKSEQVNSELQTSQLIGAIKLTCFQLVIPLKIQFASEVKSRWSDKVLQNTGYLDENNKFKGQRTSNHKRDALRHALHFWRYKANGMEW